VETAIKLDKKDFADIPPPALDTPSNAKVSPMAGAYPMYPRVMMDWGREN
jgi:hypothetical protein